MSYSEKNINPGFPGKGGRGCLGACISVFMSFWLCLNASSAERGLISGRTFPPSATQFRVPGAMQIQHELGDGLFCLYSPTLSSAMALEPVIGEFNILVILVRLPSDSPNVQIVYAPGSPLNPDPEPVTVPKAESIFFDNRYPDQWNTPQFVIAPASSYQNYSTITLNDFFREASYDKMRITGQVGGVYVLNLPAESNFFEIYEPAIDSAASAGFNVQWGGMADPTNLTGDFDKVVIVSTMRPVPLGGVAMGRKVVWLNGRITLGVCAHELGHTFGAGHASGWYCLDQSWPLLADTTCGPIDGFADIFDPMGSGIGHYNARLKELFGWLDSTQFLNVTASGQYTLTPLETSDGLKALLFGRDNSSYYFQFRRYIGFDENYVHWNKPFGVDWTNVDGLFAHRVDTFDIFRDGFLLDMPPLDQPDNGSLLRVTVLPLGLTYTDSIAGFSITPLAIAGACASAELTVNVEVFGVACCCIIAGDANDGGDVNVGDATFIVKYIFQGGNAPPRCDQADADGGGDVNIGDATFIVKFIFQGGAAPTCPSPGNLVCL